MTAITTPPPTPPPNKLTAKEIKAMQKAQEKARARVAKQLIKGWIEQRRKNNESTSDLDDMMTDIESFCSEHWQELDDILLRGLSLRCEDRMYPG